MPFTRLSPTTDRLPTLLAGDSKRSFMLLSLLVVFMIMLWPVPSAWACDPNAVEWVAFSPEKIDVPVGGQADVSVLVRCRTNGGDFTEATRAEFEIRLVGKDADQTITVLGHYVEAFTIPLGQGFRVNHTAQVNFTLTCSSGRARAASAAPSSASPLAQLYLNNPMVLALQIDNGPNEKTHVHYPSNLSNPNQQGVVANCVQGVANHNVGGDTSEQERVLIQKSGNVLGTLGADLMISPAVPSNMLNGVYPATMLVTEDIAVQRASIDLPESVVVEIRVDEVTIQGGKDWVTVRGLIGEDGHLVARGEGSVAGAAGVEVAFVGALTHGELMGEYIVGERGSLPLGKPVVYRVEARSSRWTGYWGQFSESFANSARHTGTLSFNTSVIGVDLRESMSALTGSLLKAEADASFGTSVALEDSLESIAESLEEVANDFFASNLENKADIAREIDQASKLVEKATEAYEEVLEASIFVESVSTVTVESAIDSDNNNRINDDEILDAIRYWIRQETVPGTTQRIDDPEITVLVELWVLGQLIETSTANEQNTMLSNYIGEMLEFMTEAGTRLAQAGDMLLTLLE